MNDSKEIEQKVFELAAEQAGVSSADVCRASHFVNDLNYDSLDAIEFAMSLEDEFGVTVPDDEIDKITTVDDAIQFVQKRSVEPAAKK